MRVTTALLADAAIAANGKLYIHGGALDAIFVPQVPAAHPSLALALAISATREEYGRPVWFTVDLIAPSGQRLLRGKAGTDALNAIMPEVEDSTTVAAQTWNPLPLPEAGRYRMVIDSEQFEAVELVFTVLVRPEMFGAPSPERGVAEARVEATTP